MILPCRPETRRHLLQTFDWDKQASLSHSSGQRKYPMHGGGTIFRRYELFDRKYISSVAGRPRMPMRSARLQRTPVLHACVAWPWSYRQWHRLSHADLLGQRFGIPICAAFHSHSRLLRSHDPRRGSRLGYSGNLTGAMHMPDWSRWNVAGKVCLHLSLNDH